MSSIRPKYDNWLFVDFCVFIHSCLFYLLQTYNCSENQNKTILASHVRIGKNTQINKQSVVIFWPNWRQYGSVLNSFSCIYQSGEYCCAHRPNTAKTCWKFGSPSLCLLLFVVEMHSASKNVKFKSDVQKCHIGNS